MKKAAVLLTAAMMMTAPAFSDSLINSTIEMYNNHCILSGAQKLENYVVDENNGSIHYAFELTDSLIIDMAETDNEIRTFAVICKDDSELGEFLASCVNGCYLLAGVTGGYYCYTEVLDQFLQARAGADTDTRKLPSAGVVLNLSKQSFGYLFIVSR